MESVSWKERLRYSFDNYMAKGTGALIGGLGVLSLVVILVAAAILVITGITPEGGERLSFLEAAWESLMRTLDAGTMGGDTGWGFRIVMFAVTLGGVFVISTLIGVLTSGVEGKMEELRKGRSRVIESNHTVILGWSAQVFPIISELITANENQSKPCIVVLGNKDKVEMEDEIRDFIEDQKNTRIVCRTGNPMDPYDLGIVNINAAKSIIILGQDSENPDADVIKTILAITNSSNRRSTPYHIVAEIRDAKNYEVAKMVGKDEVEIVMVGDLISRVIAQTCRESGLSVVYTELLDFGGDEFYFTKQPELTGKTFGDILSAFEDSAVMGLKHQSGEVRLNPPMDTVLRADDDVIVIAEDDSTIKLSGLKAINLSLDMISTRSPELANPERTIILGWNWRVTSVINELDHYVAPKSLVRVVADFEDGKEKIKKLCSDIKNIKVEYQVGNTTDRRTLDDLNLPSYDHVIIMCYSDQLDNQAADARTLITLLHLRDIADKTGHTFSIVSEMLDIRNRNLAEVTRANDFIVSDKLVSLMLSQVSENKYLNAVFADIFDPEGSEIYLKPVSDYIKTGKAVNFYTIIEAAKRRNEVAFGYRVEANANDATKSYGIVVNPKKSAMVNFATKDQIIVLSEQ
jgi:voltage-gated potassium channel Kch